MAHLLARLRARRPSGDAGTTLLELLVGMVLMTIFMGMFTGAIVAMTSTANKVEAVTIATSQTNQAFLTLDKQVRYAAALTTPGVSAVSGDWYVEFDTTNTGVDVCTQLRVDQTAQQLQERTWIVTSAGAATPTAWNPMASNITNGAAPAGSATVPFTVPAAATGVSSPFQRLSFTLVATATGSSTSTTQSHMSFTALNSTAGLASNATVCQQWGRP